MTGGDVNQGVQAQEQANQQKAQEYAAQQQQAAQQQLAAYLKANPAPAATTGPIQKPSFQTPATIGGGNFSGGSGAVNAQPQANAAGQQPIDPAKIQALIAQFRGQKAG